MNDFSEYKKLNEPDKNKKAEIWQAAIGLQKVDGLETSEYLIETAKQHIEGELSFDQVKKRLDTYYKTVETRSDESRTEEADKVSARIAELLSEQTFTFSPAEYIAIHRRLFTGILDEKTAGKIRNYNISKKEWILNGKSVIYGSADNLIETLDYDFDREKTFAYNGLGEREIALNIAKFISGIWQIHPFSEGNTRTTAVFAVKYLRTFGFNVDNELFAEHSLYFRNALVRANYRNVKLGVYATMEYIDRFFENLLLNGTNILRNRDMQININAPTNDAVENKTSIKTRARILELIAKQPDISVEEMGKQLELSTSGARWNIDQLKSKGIIRRVGSRKSGHWEIIETTPRTPLN